MNCIFRNMDGKCEVTCKECNNVSCEDLDERVKSTDELLDFMGIPRDSILGSVIKILDARSFLYLKREEGGVQ